jgi:hypothetical protein
MQNSKISKTPIVRNLIIFLASAGLVIAANALRFSSAATVTGGASEINKYEMVLRGEDFETDCARGEDSAVPPIPRSSADVDTGRVGAVVAKYHEVLNCLFNQRIKIVVDIMGFGEDANDEDKMTEEEMENIYTLLSPPAVVRDAPNGQRLPCEPTEGVPPLSTYCIAQRGVEEYFEFRSAMLRAREIENTRAVEEKKNLDSTLSEGEVPAHIGFSNVGEIAETLTDLGENLNRIDREIDIARQTLDMSLAAYDEMLMALPLHRKYEEVIKALEVYRDAVSDVRKQTDLYPNAFLDVTTTACT